MGAASLKRFSIFDLGFLIEHQCLKFGVAPSAAIQSQIKNLKLQIQSCQSRLKRNIV